MVTSDMWGRLDYDLEEEVADDMADIQVAMLGRQAQFSLEDEVGAYDAWSLSVMPDALEDGLWERLGEIRGDGLW